MILKLINSNIEFATARGNTILIISKSFFNPIRILYSVLKTRLEQP